MNKKYTVIHFILLGIGLLYSFMFYNSISLEIAILAVIFSIIKPNLFISALQGENIKRAICGVLVFIIIGFDLLAISSSFINKYNKQSVSKIVDPKYVQHQSKLKTLEKNVNTAQKNINKYPSLEETLKDIPGTHSSNRAAITKTWTDGKEKVDNELKSKQELYNAELSKNIEKYKIVKNEMGYSAIFTMSSKLLKVETKTLILMIYLLFAIMLEILILYSKTLKEKESKNYIKSPGERTADLIKDINCKVNDQLLKAFENIFSNSMIATINKLDQVPDPKVETIEVKKIEEKKQVEEIEEPDPEVKEDKPELFVQKPLPIENIREYHNYVIENAKDGNIAPGYKKIYEALGLTQGEANRILNRLRDKNYLRTEGKQTLILKEDFNENDFIEEL